MLQVPGGGQKISGVLVYHPDFHISSSVIYFILLYYKNYNLPSVHAAKASALSCARTSLFNNACLTEDNAADENFNMDDDVDLSSDEESEFSHLGIYKRKKLLEFFQVLLEIIFIFAASQTYLV